MSSPIIQAGPVASTTVDGYRSARPPPLPVVGETEYDSELRERVSKRAQELWKEPGGLIRFNFYRTVLMHMCITPLIGGAIIMALCEKVKYLDGFFMAVSAITVGL